MPLGIDRRLLYNVDWVLVGTALAFWMSRRRTEPKEDPIVVELRAMNGTLLRLLDQQKDK